MFLVLSTIQFNHAEGLPVSSTAVLLMLTSGLVGALIASVLTARAQRVENKKARALHLMEVIELRLSRVRPNPLHQTQDEVLDYFGSKGGKLTPRANEYLDFLGGLDFLLYAVDQDLIKLDHVKSWLRGILRADPDTKSFILKYRDRTGDNAIFEYLLKNINKQLKEAEKS